MSRISNKSQKLDYDGDVITNLPDDITSRILSILPLSDAVATSVLSKKWEYKWASVSSIDVNDKKRYQLGKSGEALFVNFMKRIARRTQNVTSIRLKLVYAYKSRVVQSWITSLLKNKVEILHVDMQKGVVIRGEILSTKLIELVLGSVTFTVPVSSCFSNLKNMRLERVEIQKEKSGQKEKSSTGTESLVFSLPALETLQLIKCAWSNVKSVEIKAPELTTFVSETKSHAEVDSYKITIVGGRLVNFTAKGGEPEDISLLGPKIVSATLQNTIRLTEGPLQRSGLRAQSLFKGFSSTLEELKLSIFVSQALLESKQSFPLRFDKLQRLVLCSSDHVSSGNTEALIQLLHSMPFLKSLVIDVLRWDEFAYDTVESIPSCILFSLEELEFFNITKMGNVFQLAKFLLKNAANLKKVRVDSLYEEVKDKFVKHIESAYPKGSTCSTVAGLTSYNLDVTD